MTRDGANHKFNATLSLQWRHNWRGGVSNHRRLDRVLNRLFKRRSKTTPKLRAIGLCDGNSLVTCDFPAQRASNAEHIFIWWRHHGYELELILQHIKLITPYHWYNAWISYNWQREYLVFVLNNTLILGIWCSTIAHLPGCFCPWTFFQNIGFNTALTDPFMSHLATQLGYSAGEFQALQLIVLAAFDVVD